ncbi:MAG: hypothetical protein ABIQ52_14750 [Vicinamibacterales bacterium]
MIGVRGATALVSQGLTALVLLTRPCLAAAQPYVGSNGPHRGSVEVGGGVIRIGSYDAGSAEALLTTAGGAAPLTLFVVDAEVPAVMGAAVQAGVYLGRRVSLETTFHFTRPTLQSRQSSDFESASEVVAETTTSSYLIGGSLLYHFGEGRLVPFLSGGAGYLRQLSEGNAEVTAGTEVHAGGGVKYWIGSGARRVALRLDAQASARDKLVAFEQKRRILPSLGAGVTFRF